MSGAGIRLGRLFGSAGGRSLVIAFDHGASKGPLPGAESARVTLTAIVDGRPDGVFVSPGLLRHCADLFAQPRGALAIVRADLWMNDPEAGYGGEERRIIATPQAVVRLGGDAMVLNLVLGTSGRFLADAREAIARTADEAHVVGIPLIVEVVDWGPHIRDDERVGLLTYGVRVAAEHGADAVKTPFLGSPAEMARLVTVCPVPVLALGGEAVGDEQIAAQTRAALGAGARGLVYGRNVWQAPDPAGRLALLRRILSEDMGPGTGPS